MFFNDFEYDNVLLSSFGFITCMFDNGGMETKTNGSELKLSTYSTKYGRQKHKLATSYDECITSTFCICKDPNIYGYENLTITIDELRTLTKWLNRSDYYKFKIIDNYEYSNFYFEATFNVSKIMVGDKIIGLELTMETNRPYAIGGTKVVTLKGTTPNWTGSIPLDSDEEGYVYPKMEVTISQNGTLDILNELEQRHTVLRKCVAGEKIVFDYPIAPQSSNPNHDTREEFNWYFFRLGNSYTNNINNIKVSIPCEIRLEYNPIVKVGI